MTVTEAAKELGVSPERVRKFCQQGRLGTKFDGRTWIITREELEEFKRIPRSTGRPKKEEINSVNEEPTNE